MKLQAITLVTVVTSFFLNTNADAGRFDLGQVIRTAQKIDRQLNHGPITRPSPNPPVYPLPEPPRYKPAPPVCKPAPPIYKPAPPVCKKPAPPINRPPVQCARLKLMNNAGADVYFVLNNAHDYATLRADDVEIVESHTHKPHLISYHNGQELVEYELDANGVYGFEWQGQILQLVELQG